MMKNVICGILAFIVIVGGFIGAGYVENNYTRHDCVVIENKGGYTTFTDKTGYEFTFKGDFYKVGDRIDVKMNTNGTNSVLDDVVKEVRTAR